MRALPTSDPTCVSSYVAAKVRDMHSNLRWVDGWKEYQYSPNKNL